MIVQINGEDILQNKDAQMLVMVHLAQDPDIRLLEDAEPGQHPLCVEPQYYHPFFMGDQGRGRGSGGAVYCQFRLQSAVESGRREQLQQHSSCYIILHESNQEAMDISCATLGILQF